MTEQVKKDGVEFTPGPWSSQGVWVFTDDAAIAKAQYGGEEAPNFVTAEANAHLIAASPELFDALETLVDALMTGAGRDFIEAFVRDACAALEKAQPGWNKQDASSPSRGVEA